MRNKFVYFFSKKLSEGSKEMKSLLGGKGSGLAEMASIGLPVPAGFTITTEVCELFYKNDRHYPAGLEKQVDENMRKLEKEVGKKFGDADDPLLVSVRSGAAAFHARHDGNHPQPRPERPLGQRPGQKNRQPPLRPGRLPPLHHDVRFHGQGHRPRRVQPRL